MAALRATIRATTMRVGRAERVWSLLRIRGMAPALLTSFSAKGAADLMLVYMPLLGIALGFSAQEVGMLLGISSGGAMFARAGTPLLARRMPVLKLTTRATVVAALCLLALPLSERFAVLAVLSALLGFSLGLTQTTTMAWVVGLVGDTSRGSALGLRVSTNRLGQAVVLAAAGAVSGALGVTSAFVLLGSIMLVTAAAGALSERPGAGGHSTGE
jgi:predicted MFS family arabinose efflux permease